jgi:oxazoline/thiazoline synthase
VQSHRGSGALRAALLPGGAVLCDDQGRVRFGLRDEAFESLEAESSDLVRLAVAHLAAIHAADAGLLEEPFERAVGEGGAVAVPSHEPAHRSGEPTVLTARSHVDGGFVALASRLRAEGQDVLPVVRAGAVTYIGPLLRSDGSPCVACLHRAVWPNRQTAPLLDPPGNDSVAEERLRRTALTAWQENAAVLGNSILELDGDGTPVVRHRVRRFDDCSVCGRLAINRNTGPPRLRSVPKRSGSDTGARASHPEAVYERFEHLVSPLTGAVRHVTEVDTGAPGLIHVYTAGHAVHMGSTSLREFMRDGRDHSGGKGGTSAQARASALCEALERFSSIFRGGEVDALGSGATLKGALDPSDFMLFSRSQYRTRKAWNRAITSRFQKVPEPFDDQREIAWSRVWSLVSGREAFVPTSILYLGFRGPGSEFCNADSNGLAAGETLEEAVLQGFLELVERDAIALWWYNRTRRPAVDLREIGDDYAVRVFEHYASVGRQAWVLDLTSDLGIPVYVAISGRVGYGAPEVIFGFGAHLDRSIALRRCVTEMNQMYATVMRPPEERRGQLRGEFDDALHWWANATLDRHPYLVPSPDASVPPMTQHTCDKTGDILEDVMSCLDIARRGGMEVYVRDMTRADLGLAVVKVMVPGLRHFWRRLAPGRLYEVPVATGRSSAPLDETEMNPVSLFV